MADTRVLQSSVVDPALFNCATDVRGVGDSSRVGGNPASNPEL
jgi:hypothetical protein